jgi:hypothetical protein|tara:strand:- start:297 stop:785 length:489 start_codon:yes stop_codon:yes gene_type:complete
MTKKQEKIWAYKLKNPQATVSQIAKATKSSYGYVYKLMQKIGTPPEVLITNSGVISTSSTGETTSTYDKHVGVNRSYVLDTAKEYVTKDRAADHGNMEDNFTKIAEYWSLHLDTPVYSDDVAVMMTLLKLARIKSNREHCDNWIDGAGYLACGAELVAKRSK